MNMKGILNVTFGTVLNSFWSKLTFFVSGVTAFLITYFTELAIDHATLFLAIVAATLLDGIFGILAGIKREGFKTRKALSVLKTLVSWIFIAAALITIEHGVPGMIWLSDTVLVPYIIVQVVSALKNAAVCGYIEIPRISEFLDNIDTHKKLDK